MSGKRWQIFFVSWLITLTLFTSGCFHFKADIDIHEDGSVTVNRTMMGNEFMQDEIEKSRKEVKKNDPDAKLENITEGNMKGFRADTDYSDIGSMAKSGKMFDAHKGYNHGVQMKNGLLCDTYAFDLNFSGNGKDLKDLPKDQQEIAKAMLSDIKFDITLNLPYPALSTNADKVTNDGKTLYWNLAKTLVNDEDASVKTVFRIWHKDRVMGAGAAALILLLSMLNFMAKMKKSGQDVQKLQKAKNNAILCGVLLALLAGGAYYLTEQKPVFTEQDIISNVKGEEAGAHPSESGKTKTTEPAEMTEKAEKVQTERVETAKSSDPPKPQALDISIKPSAETALGPVDPGVPFDQLRESLGREEKPSKLDNDGFTHYYYPDLEVIVGNGRVESVYSNSSQVQTKRGLKQGDREQDVLQVYGQPYGKTEYNGSILYEYQFQSANSDNCLLRFAVKNGVIDYVGSRIVR